MPAAPPSASAARPAGPRAFRFGIESESDAPGVLWLLKRNCSATPRQVLLGYVSICIVSTLIASVCWWQGAALVAPFAGLELFAVGLALVVYARHATDHERIHLQHDRLTVERVDAGRVERTEFATHRVRVARGSTERRLIEVSAGGRHVAIGRFLRPDQRRLLADELRWALRCGAPVAIASAAGAASRRPQPEP